jgi:hypothetical protein
MAITRIQNNQIFDKTITYAKIADATLVGTLFNPDLLLNSNITIVGNLDVQGATNTISSTNTYVNDPLVVFNWGYTGTPTYDVGILVNRDLNSFNTAWIWNEANQAFEGILTTDTGGGAGVINNSGYTTVKCGNVRVVSSATIANVGINGNSLTTSSGDLDISPASGNVAFAANVSPSVDSTYDLGLTDKNWNNIYSKTVTVGGAIITTNNGNVTITPPTGGQTVVANLAISGTTSTFTGNITSGNVTITGGNITNVTIGGTSNATLTSLTDTGNLTANGTNATISFQPTGTGTVTINPSTTGTISNMAGSFTTLSSSSTTTLASTSATSLTTANAQITGGNVIGVSISNSPISGSTGSFTTLSASSTSTLSTTNINGVANITDTTQSTSTTTGALIVAGGVGIGKDVNIGGNLVVDQTSTLGNIVVANNSISSTGNVAISATGAVKIGALSMPQTDGVAGSVMVTDGNGNVTFQTTGSFATGNVIPLGTPTTGTLTDNNPAISTWTASTVVTDAVDKLNEILGKLIPPAPPVFPNGTTLTVSGLSSGLRMTNFTQTDNTGVGSTVAAGTTLTAYRRSSSYTTNTIVDVGPGDSGTVSVVKNGSSAGSHLIVSGTGNGGTYSDLIISNNVDYGTIDGKALGFWYSFNVQGSGTVPSGWNIVNLTDTAGSPTNNVVWYYDASAPGTPVFSSLSMSVSTPATAYSSSVPHYTSSTVWGISGNVNRLSGDLYPASDSFITGSSGGSFQSPASVTYAAASITTPLVRNLYVSSGSAAFTTTVNTANVTGQSAAGVSLSSNNSYATGTGSVTPGGTVLTINTSDTSTVNENNVVVGSFGSGGSSYAVRVGGLGNGLTPTTGGVTSWTSSASLQAYDAAVVAGVATANNTDYSTGYFPTGPNLSGRDTTQYITFRIQRDATSKFDVKFSGKVSGCQVAMPGSSLDTTAAPTNGWIDASVSYSGSGVPGTGTGGNGSVGCGLGGVVPTGTTVSNSSSTVTFGTESSHNSTNFYIYVRFALGSGDSITSLSFPVASH